MTAGFPFPYTVADALAWIDRCNRVPEPTNYAILSSNDIVGGCGYDFGSGERWQSAEIGYWLGVSYWGRGLATAAFRALTARALETPHLLRLQATIYSPNAASARVAEKCGYVREAVLRNAISKDGEIFHAFIYALVRDPI